VVWNSHIQRQQGDSQGNPTTVHHLAPVTLTRQLVGYLLISFVREMFRSTTDKLQATIKPAGIDLSMWALASIIAGEQWLNFNQDHNYYYF